MSDHIFSDQEIADLIIEPKRLPHDWRSRNIPITEGNMILQTIETTSENNNIFALKLRQNTIKHNDFCLTFALKLQGKSKLFHLKRYDSKQQHSNPIEKQKFYDFHIHIATERYQNFGFKNEDHYAEITNKYNDYEKALKCLLEDCNFIIENNPQINMFGGDYGIY